MDISAEKQPIPRLVLAALSVGPDVRRLQGRQCSFPCHRASPLIHVRHQNTESALTQPRMNQVWLTKPFFCPTRIRRITHRLLAHPVLDSFPKSEALCLIRVVGLERYY